MPTAIMLPRTTTIVWAGSLLSLGLLGGCTQDPFEDLESHERAITSFTLDKGQIGVAEIMRTPETGKVTIYAVRGTDLSSVVPRIETSYKATVSPASGQPVNLTANNRTYTYTVTAESGEAREWTVEVKDYESDLDGRWQVTNMQFQYFIGEGESWGWNGTKNLSANIPDATKENDNILEMTTTGVTADGKVTGTFTHSPGPDGQFANFLFGAVDYNYKFRKLPRNQGTWLRDFATNTIVFNNGQPSQSRTVTLEFSTNKRTLKMPFNVQPYDIDWTGSGNKQELGGAKFAWYMFSKI
jgi:hypothetical protein